MYVEGYEVVETISRSGRSHVCRARRTTDGTSVVIKSIASDHPDVDEIAKLEFEYRILRKLDAPGVLRALDLVRGVGNVALIVEDFGGRPPFHVAGAEAVDVFLGVATAIAGTLGVVHAQNIIHKDIKPRNILVNPLTREVKLIDFNTAIEGSHEHQDANNTRAQQGSLAYMSPEQTGRMNRDLDYRGDYYSLGVTCFELLTGTLPFSATDAMGWVHCHLSKQAPDARSLNPAIPAPVAQIVRKLLAKDPDDRYQSARGLVMDLARCQREWTEKRAISEFQLGGHDVSERFQISKKLFGREQDVAALLESFESASVGPAKLLLVGGYSGVGKSSLINELQRVVVRSRGYFIAGKFDQLERNVPYGALLQALRGLIRHLLAEPDDRVQAWRQRLSSGLAANAKVLLDLAPELEGLLGKGQALPELDAHEARLRLQRVFRDFIKIVARPEHPLVIFIDDLQWTDASTVELLSTLLSDENLRYVLVIAAYRDNEVKEGQHALSLALKSIVAARPDAVTRLQLSPLSEQSVQALVAETLHCDPQLCAPLANLVFQKTAGNPFFVNELLRLLQRDGAFHFHSGDGRWEWDMEKIRSASISDNIVDLMVDHLRSLPKETLEYLCTAACLGGHFDLMTLATVAERPAHAIAAALRAAVHVDVLIPIGDAYRLIGEDSEASFGSLTAHDVEYKFQHERVRQAAYQLLAEQERTRLHLRIGRLKLAAMRTSGQEEDVFDVVNHLNLCRELITAPEERAELSRLNAVAGQRARRSAAYSVAIAYFELSLDLLSTEARKSSPELGFEYSRALVECVWLTGDIERANLLADQLIEAASDKIARGSAVELKVTLLEHEGRMLDAVRTIRSHLSAFGIDLPEDPTEIERRIGESIGKMQAHLARVPIEDLHRLPELEDRELHTAMILLSQVIPSAIQTYPPLFILVELIMFDIALTHGKAEVSCKNFVDCGIIQGGILGDYATGYRLGKAAFVALEKYAPTPLESAVSFVFGAFISHWRAPVREGLDAFARSLRAGLELGDPRHATFSRVHTMQRKLLIGVNLDELQVEFDDVIPYLVESRAANALVGARAAQRVTSRLRDPSLSSHPSDAFTAELVAFGNAQWVFSYGQAETMASVLLGDSGMAEEWQKFTAPMASAGAGLFAYADYHLVEALILVKGIASEPGAEREKTLGKLLANQEKLRIWADNCPANFAHKYQLCSAEIARLQARPTDEIIQLYDQAIVSCADDFVNLRAFANERLGEYWSEKGQPKIARTFIEEARYLYGLWGARAKLRQLELRYPEWLGHVEGGPRTTARRSTTGDSWTGALDLESIIKATQTISSEVRIDKLFTKLMATLIENAGAEQGCLILVGEQSAELTVAARAHVARELPDAGHALPLEDSSEQCSEIVRYVARTQDTVVVDNAAHDPSYADYAYIRRNAVKSLLCMPVLNQGKLVAILYAENNATTRAFTAQRLSLLQVIASQAAISLTNAQLYDKLEEKVSERTRELREKNREIGAMLNSMQQGIFTVGESLTIQPEYSPYLERILERKDIAGRDCLQAVFEGSNVGVDALDATRAALVVSFGSESFFAAMNASHLVQDFHRIDERGESRYFEVDWNPIADEHDLVQKYLVALRDVSLVRQLKETVAANGRELSMLGQVLDAGIEPFQRFCASARTLLGQIDAALAAPSLGLEALEICFRNMHTVKGNARALGLSELVDVAHLAEEAYAELRRDRTKTADRAQLAAGQLAIRSAIDGYERVFRLKLGDVTRGSGARAEQTLREIRALVKDALTGTLAPAQSLRDLDRILSRAEAIPLAELVKGSARMLPSLASELDKAPPVVECDAEGVLLTPAWAEVMRDVLPHALRNALDHGIEAPHERKACGKPAQGRIELRAERLPNGVAIRFADDGRGLRLAVLRERAGSPEASDEEVAKTVFLSGVSTVTTLSQTSGRGVGMNAIRAFVCQRGGGVRIAFTAEASGGYRPFELIFELPEDATLAR